jgi:hypothetical protein
MIGATPTFYDPELESQPPTQEYPDWTTTYGQPQHPLTSSSSYPHQHSTTDPHPDSQAHPPPQRHDRYQFVNQPAPSTSPDATQFPYFSSFVDSSNSLSQAMRPQGWSAPQSSVYSQAPAPNNTYFDLMSQQYSTSYDTPQGQSQHPTQPAEQVSGLAVTPASDSRVSPASANNALPSPGSSHTPTRTVLVHPNTRRGGKSTPGKVRKRQKPESDDDDDDDVLSVGIDTNVSRPNPNRL